MLFVPVLVFIDPNSVKVVLKERKEADKAWGAPGTAGRHRRGAASPCLSIAARGSLGYIVHSVVVVFMATTLFVIPDGV